MWIYYLIAGVVAVILYSRNAAAKLADSALPGTAPVAVGQFVNANGQTVQTTSLKQAQIQNFTKIGTAVTGAISGAFIADPTLFASLGVTGPVGLAIAGVIAAVFVVVGMLRGVAHLYANEWVQKVQNPFGVALGAIANANANAMMDGSASRQSVSLAIESIQNLWSHYRTLGNQFAAQGHDQSIVVNQSYQTLSPLVEQLLRDMGDNMSSLPA